MLAGELYDPLDPCSARSRTLTLPLTNWMQSRGAQGFGKPNEIHLVIGVEQGSERLFRRKAIASAANWWTALVPW